MIDLLQLSEALSRATTVSGRISAEALLSDAEIQMPNYYSALQYIYQTPSYDQSVRLLAAITFKNGIDRYWRKTAKK